ncbi:MAG: cytochrome c peroxidase, partial [Hyphomicrobiales bacterium]
MVEIILRPKKTILALTSALITLTGVSTFAADQDSLKEKYKRPLSIPFEGVTPYSPQLATLGKMLFFDPRLSGAKNINCSSCHNPSFGYEVP